MGASGEGAEGGGSGAGARRSRITVGRRRACTASEVPSLHFVCSSLEDASVWKRRRVSPAR